MDFLDIYILTTTLSFTINALIEYKAYLSAKKRAFKYKRFNDYYVSGRLNLKKIKNVYLVELPSILIDSLIPINNLIVMYYEVDDYDRTEKKFYDTISKLIVLIDKTESEDREEMKRILNDILPNEKINQINYKNIQKLLKERKICIKEDYTSISVKREVSYKNKRYVYDYKYKE